MDRQSFSRMVRPMQQAISRRAARVVARLVDDTTKLQILQIGIMAGETAGGVERFQNYGFTSKPLEGAEGVVVFLGGGSDHPICIVMDDRRYRKNDLASGETAVYNHVGDFIHIKADGSISVKASASVDVDAPEVTMSGNLTVAGNITSTTGNISATAGNITAPAGDVVAGTVSGKNHVHINSGGVGDGGVPKT